MSDDPSSSPVPSTSSTLVSSSPTSNWQAIRPWFPLLNLIVREITSVSVTFLLSAAANQSSDDLDLDVDLKHELENDEPAPTHASIISEALAKGLSVKVNGSPWQRVFIRIDDPADEAIIIIYGLMPGRQYDIDLGIVHTRHLRRQITTEDSEPSSPSSPSIAAITPVINNNATTTAPTAPHNTTDSINGPPAPPPFTIEDRLAQLNNTLSLLHTERETLQSQIKTVRRDGQKADAALRTEIDILKRAADKHTAAEARSKQKILAIQEAVKRTQAGARVTDEQIAEIENSLPGIMKEKEEKEAEYERVKKDAERVRKERESADEKDKKRLDKMRAELSILAHKLEKMKGKREKLETLVPDLEDQLKETSQELENLAKEEDELNIHELASMSGMIGVSDQDYSYDGLSRRRANTGGNRSNSSTISRPQPLSDNGVSPPWNSTVPPRLRDSSALGQLDPSFTLQTHSPTRLESLGRYSFPPGFMHFNHSDPLHSALSSPTSSSSDSPIGPHHPGLQKSTTSPYLSRTSTFEPSRSVSYVAPIQRPNGAGVSRSKSGVSPQSRHV
ncbi:hypothetical protein AGABI2DRAFT_120656 [Agaricus bisporus var. bisporus H97]|uniref:hypothetical protein n=1 Tax=Agaricus bisporus var. bisporus (strain H97 / ATCC MYA-4626 / FGSC 10389) TaxID=936046 RepID=UPI00029F5546|nr:hypothetical protein AGABI2DRAFT_120656 [Agaricus bisporus var. bisporus H97]EKV44541.1 hypothetical protein AGABI2DRAFT_120656 [Agaricus bisporus var. bisporus H97]